VQREQLVDDVDVALPRLLPAMDELGDEVDGVVA
jgi:hypothetical protein